MGIGSTLVSVGAYRPERRCVNAQLSVADLVNDEWVRERTGIAARRYARADEGVVDMAYGAARAALRAGGLSAADVDAVVVATCSMPSGLPNAAASVAARLNRTVAAFDVNAACSGFMYALIVADGLVRAGTCRTVLVIGAEKMTDWVDPSDEAVAPLFADGAGAVVMRACDRADLGPAVWGSDGSRAGLIEVADRHSFLRMQGPAVYRWAVTELAVHAKQACADAGVAPEDLAAFVPHQANLRIVRSLAAALGLGDAVVGEDIVESGNTSAASIPLALARLIGDGRLVGGEQVLLMGFGAGLTYAAQVVRCPASAAEHIHGVDD